MHPKLLMPGHCLRAGDVSSEVGKERGGSAQTGYVHIAWSDARSHEQDGKTAVLPMGRVSEIWGG